MKFKHFHILFLFVLACSVQTYGQTEQPSTQIPLELTDPVPMDPNLTYGQFENGLRLAHVLNIREFNQMSFGGFSVKLLPDHFSCQNPPCQQIMLHIVPMSVTVKRYPSSGL